MLRRGGWLDPQPIARYWHEHRTGARDWSAGLWAVLMFQSWLAQAGVYGRSAADRRCR